jgi:hypothetical protein
VRLVFGPEPVTLVCQFRDFADDLVVLALPAAQLGVVRLHR